MDQNNSPTTNDFTYPDISNPGQPQDSTATTTPDPVQTPQDTPVPQPVNDTPDPNTGGTGLGEEISGPPLEGQAETPEQTPESTFVPEKELPTPEIQGDTPAEVLNEAPMETPVEEVIEEKKEGNPLKALADKLNALKSELVEEVPVTEAPEVPSEVPVEMSVPEVQPEEEVDNIPTLDTPVPMTPAVDDVVQSDLSSIMPGPKEPIEELPSIADEPTVGSTESDTGNDIPSVADEVASAPVEDLTQTGPDEVMEETPSAEEPTATPSVTPSNVIGTSQKAADFKPGKFPHNITEVLDLAIKRNASDVQISVGYPVMIRIDGSLIAISDNLISPNNAEELILPVLSDQKKELLEVNREVDLAYAHENDDNARFRINAYYTRGNLSAAFRLIPSTIRTIEQLNLPPMYNQFANLTQGLVLVTGPTGHGKSTTLAAILQAINNTRAVHMLTIEDPIEYIFPKGKAVIDQREMHDDTHSWTIALKSALRQDPDVILVGEMRDYETIASTITLAETGHLVFATLHTNSASQTIDRIIDVFPENQQAQIRTQLANILEAVVAQRLIPLQEGGRRAVSEIMMGNPAVRNLIREGRTHQLDNVIRTSADVGMVSLESSLVKLVREGMITMERAQEFAVHPEEVVRLLKN
jgi:twitching motility protein PilT